ncbi:MAG: helix-turn-helix domain-containing protein [Candidatus Marsarchaeota archaeon]|nr:helix-turn-helix domain-containing protein [Candidatus Marsarchaeota archaeon]
MRSDGNKLGVYLLSARERKHLTLRAVERATGISNPYLSQLESGKIQQPSPGMLYKLSEVYGVPYNDVLELAGYPVPDARTTKTGNNSSASRIGPVTREEEEALIEYLEFLRARKGRGSKR